MAAELVVIQPRAALARGANVQTPPALAYLARLRSEGGRRAMRHKLELAARILSRGQHDALSLPWAELDGAHLAGLVTLLASDHARPDGGAYASRTVNAVLAAVRGVMRECWRSGALTADELARAVDVRPEAVTTVKAGRGLDAGEIALLFRAARADGLTTRGRRDAALLAVLFGGGLRAAECVGLDLADLDLDAEAVKVRRGKGRKTRVVPLAAGAGDALAAWLEIRGPDDGPLLASIDRRGNVGGRLSTRAVQRIAGRLAAAAGVDCWTPHDARRSYIGGMLDLGLDLSSVQRLAGHASPVTTAAYDRRPDEALRQAARLMRLPA